MSSSSPLHAGVSWKRPNDWDSLSVQPDFTPHGDAHRVPSVFASGLKLLSWEICALISIGSGHPTAEDSRSITESNASFLISPVLSMSLSIMNVSNAMLPLV